MIYDSSRNNVYNARDRIIISLSDFFRSVIDQAENFGNFSPWNTRGTLKRRVPESIHVTRM